MFTDCDYIKTYDDFFFIVRGYYHPPSKIRASTIFFPDENGNRVERTTGKRYIRKIEEYQGELISQLHPEYMSFDHYLKDDYGVLVNADDVKLHYKPKGKMREVWGSGKLEGTKWERLVKSMNDIADIPLEDMGIYGSILVDLHKDLSDVDMVIYGTENLRKLKENFEHVLEDSEIRHTSDQDFLRISEGWARFHPIDVKKIFNVERRKWTRIYAHGDNMSIKFVYNEDEILPNPITSPPIEEIRIKGTVTDSFGSHFLPRMIKVESDGGELDVVTYFWLFFSCAEQGDDVEIFGNYREDGDRRYVTLDKLNHYITPLI